MSMVVGLIVAALSLWGMLHWRQDLVVVLRGLVPLLFLGGGILAVIAGFTTITSPPPASRPRNQKAPGGDGAKKPS